MTRLRPALLGAALALLASGCLPESSEYHVLNRMGYGPDSWTLQRLRTLGLAGYVDEQLHPERLDDGLLEADLAARYPTLSMKLGSMKATYSIYNTDPAKGVTVPRQELSEAKVLRALRSRRQLEQVLVDFWINHFNVDGRKEIARWAIVTYERDAIRPHVFGRFRDMLRATAGHAAMLMYLDNNENFREGFIRQSRPWGPNENYAREILELHTVGVDGGYTLNDIQEVARAFTGWTIPWELPWGHDGFEYLADGHDTGAKQVMGLSIPAGGQMSDGEAVIDFLARRPATAQHIARKLCERFVSEAPPATLVSRVAQVFRDTDGDLREVVRTILLSSEFLTQAYVDNKTKRPLHYVASLARSVGVADEATFARQAVSEIRTMGEDLYGAGPPTGHPERSLAWQGEGAFVYRVNFAAAAAERRMGFGPMPQPSGTTSLERVRDLERKLRVGPLDPTTRQHVIDLFESFPEDHRVAQAGAVLLSTPSFLKH
jgi:hypothetical protein